MEPTVKATLLKMFLFIFENKNEREPTYVWHPFLELPAWPEKVTNEKVEL